MPRIGQQSGKAAVASATAAGALAAALLAPDRAPAADPPQGYDGLLQQKVEVKEVVAEKVAVQGQVMVKEQLGDGRVVDRLAPAGLVPGVAVNGLGVNAEQAVQTAVLRLGLILRVELRYLTLSAHPTPEQRREIAVEAGRVLKEYARTQAGGNVAGVVVAQKVAGGQPKDAPAAAPAPGAVVNRRVANPRVDPRKLIHDAVEVAARAKLAPEQFAQYQAELDGKLRERREVVLVNVVAKLDGLLALGQDQRDKLQEALRTHWDDRNFPTVETIAMYEQYYPTIQDVLILPILSDGQQKIWRNAQKINFASIRVNQQAGGNQFLTDADLDGDADLKAALAPEVNP